MTGRAFGVGAALTVALDAPGPPHSTIGPWCDLSDLYGILGWLVGDIPTVEQLPATIAAARGLLLAQHPELGDATGAPPSDSPDTEVLAWLAAQEAVFGPTITVDRPQVNQ